MKTFKKIWTIIVNYFAAFSAGYASGTIMGKIMKKIGWDTVPAKILCGLVGVIGGFLVGEICKKLSDEMVDDIERIDLEEK